MLESNIFRSCIFQMSFPLQSTLKNQVAVHTSLNDKTFEEAHRFSSLSLS